MLTADDLVLVTDGRYGDQAVAQLAAAGVDGRVLVGLSGTETDQHLAASIAGSRSAGFEAAH